MTKEQIIRSVPFQCLGVFVRPDETETTFKCFLNALREVLPPFAYIFTIPGHDWNAKEITCGFISFFTLSCQLIECIWREIHNGDPQAEASVRLYARTPLKRLRVSTTMSSDIELWSSHTKRGTLPWPSQLRFTEIRTCRTSQRRYLKGDERTVPTAYEEILQEGADKKT